MAAFVVVAPPVTGGPERPGLQLNIFPGSATPSIFPAGVPFWIGYGFVPDLDDPPDGTSELTEDTRFELDVDGAPVAVRSQVTARGDRTVGRLEIAPFPAGLSVGWHRFAGRWYVRGRLVLTCDTSVEFVESRSGEPLRPLLSHS